MKPVLHLLAPRLAGNLLGRIARLAAAGTLVAAAYGCLHDQLTYTLCGEYFTRMKFAQFAWADLGLPRRVMAGEVGVLATWWVGLLGTWIFARLAAALGPPERLERTTRGMWGWMLLGALAGGVAGAWCGGYWYAGEEWTAALDAMGVVEQEAFARVAGIHLGSYLGGAAGWGTAVVMLGVRMKTQDPRLQDTRIE